MQKIPLAKPELGDEEITLMAETIRSGWITQGPRVAEFERAFAAYVEARHAVAVSSCTTALHLALKLLEVGQGDEVIVTPHSFIASANAIRYCGATPVFVDIDPLTLNIAPEKISAAITSRAKAIMVIHQVGRPANLEAIGRIAKKNNLPLIEDAACAIGSKYRGRKIGHNGYSSLVCFSFHPRKIISTGDGGMITTDNEEWNERLRRLRQHGMSVNDLQRHQAAVIVTEAYLELGYNYRLTDLQAALGVAQLKRLPFILERRRAIAARYDRELERIPQLELFHEPADARWNQQTYLARLRNATAEQRDRIMQKLFDAGIATRRGIMSIHREPCYTSEYGAQHFPESERASDQCLCLPLYPQMTAEEQNYVLENVRNVMA
jgi:dTDP-4-amino-4,6-dideoxygalactose transaminase